MSFIREISAEEVYTIRQAVLRKNIDLPYRLKGDLDVDTFHLGAFKEDKLVGVVSFMRFTTTEIKGSQYQLRGMATLPDVRGEGFGKLLVVKGIELLKDKKIAVVWCNAREKAVGFYRKIKFETIGNSFDIDKVGVHYRMKKELLIEKGG